MKAKELLQALALPLEVAQRKIGTHPILGHIRLAEGKAAANNFIAAVEVELAGVPELGCCVPAVRFKDALDAVASLAPDFDVKLKLDGKTLKITAPRVRQSMPTLPHEDFPMPVRVEKSTTIKDWPGFVSTLAFAVHAALVKDIARPYLNGVASRDGYLCASDGHRAAIARGESPITEQLIIPTEQVGLICALPEGQAYASDGNSLAIEFAGGRFSVQLVGVGHPYPDMERVVPKQHAPDAVKIERTPLERAVAAVSKTHFSAAVEVSVERDVAVLSDESHDGGARIELQIAYEGKPWSTAMNTGYLKSAIGVLDGEHITLSYDPGTSRILVTGKRESRSVVLMPWRK